MTFNLPTRRLVIHYLWLGYIQHPVDWQPAVCSVKERRFPLGRALFEHWPLHYPGGRKASAAGEDFAAARIILNRMWTQLCMWMKCKAYLFVSLEGSIASASFALP